MKLFLIILGKCTELFSLSQVGMRNPEALGPGREPTLWGTGLQTESLDPHDSSEQWESSTLEPKVPWISKA